MIQGQQGALAGILTIAGKGVGAAPVLRSGETVTVSVLREAAPGHWVVAVRGRTVTASSNVPLVAGSTVTARVAADGSTVLLRLGQPAPGMANALSAARLPVDPAAQAAARALLASGLGVTAERVQQLRSVFREGDTGAGRRLRLAAELIRKLPGLDPGDVEALIRLVGPPEGRADADADAGAGDRRRRKRTRRPPVQAISADAVREGLWRRPADDVTAGVQTPREIDLLRLFNHAAPEPETWIVLPCGFAADGGAEVSGSVRVLYDTRKRAVLAVVVGASAEGGPSWWFHIVPGQGGLRCRASCDSAAERGRAAEAYRELRAQLGNLGVAVADTVGDGARFDGFSVAETGEPRPVDLLG